MIFVMCFYFDEWKSFEHLKIGAFLKATVHEYDYLSWIEKNTKAFYSQVCS